MQVRLIDGEGQVVFYEVCRCREVEVPLKGLQKQKLHVKETLFAQHQIHGAHAAQTVERLQLWDAVFSLLKLT